MTHRRYLGGVFHCQAEAISNKLLIMTKVLSSPSSSVLSNNQSLLAEAINSIRDYAIFLLDPNGIVSTWNTGAARFKGYSAEEIIGQHFSKFYPEEDIIEGKCELELREAASVGRHEDEGWRLRKDGSRFWANVIITAIRDPQKNIIGFAKITRDLTERKKAEETLQLANENLEQNVLARTLELQQTKQELEKALLTRDEFLSIASHELKTPITSIKLQSQILRTRSPTPERLSKSLEIIVRQSQRLSRLIEDLLDLSRVQSGQFSFNFENENLSDLLDLILLQWKEPLSSAGCELHTEIQPNVIGSIDNYRFEQVIVNLLTNIIKYAPGERVCVKLSENNEQIFLSVGDSGGGIAPSLQDKIFDRYERASNSSGIAGLGLGLFISKIIVEAHHGKISVVSSAEKGTEFLITLPL